MSVITATSQRTPVSLKNLPRGPVSVSNYEQQHCAAIGDIPPRRSSSASASSYSSNYSSAFSSTPPTVYSPTSPRSPTNLSFKQHIVPPPTPTIPNSFFPRQNYEPALGCLPPAVYACIFKQLQTLHEAPDNHQYGCTTCFLRDLHALALTSRTLERAVRSKLYNRIHILGADSPAQLKKYRLKRGSRLKLLRRTLRERKLLANLVLELSVPDLDLAPTVNGKANQQWEDYRDLIASVVMVCPNLERLIGWNMTFHHEFDRLTYALSTRKRLKEHQWILGEPIDSSSTTVGENSRVTSTSSSTKPTTSKALEPQQAFEFLHYHASWGRLETLMLHSLSTSGVLEHGIFLRIFNRLPGLRNLYISSFDAPTFTDRTLQFLPSLESLRLENMKGVTDGGISQYMSRPEARSLRSLALIEQNIGSLLLISKIFASLRILERFTFVQSTRTPVLSADAMVFQPILASATLKYLHWDVTGPDSAAGLGQPAPDFQPFVMPHKPYDSPNFHLAQSILHSGFPSLTSLRAPSDIEPPGILQSVCRPVARGQALLPSDRYSLPRSSHGSVSTRPLALPAGNNLTSARIRAQTFIDIAAKDSETGMKVLVTDHSDSYVPDSALDNNGSDDEEDDEEDIDLFGGSYSGAQKAGRPLSSSNQANDSSDGPKTIFEFRMPAIMGIVRAIRHGKDQQRDCSIPRFVLQPDVPGIDSDGGLIGWKHLVAPNNSSLLLQSTSSPPYPLSTSPNALKRSESDLSTDSITSPTTTTAASAASRLWFGSRSSSVTSPTTTTHPPTPITYTSSMTSTSSTAPWTRDTCNGAWNSGHPKDWWIHFERERKTSMDSISMMRLF